MTSKVDFIRIYIEQYMKREKRRHSVKKLSIKNTTKFSQFNLQYLVSYVYSI